MKMSEEENKNSGAEGQGRDTVPSDGANLTPAEEGASGSNSEYGSDACEGSGD